MVLDKCMTTPGGSPGDPFMRLKVCCLPGGKGTRQPLTQIVGVPHDWVGALSFEGRQVDETFWMTTRINHGLYLGNEHLMKYELHRKNIVK